MNILVHRLRNFCQFIPLLRQLIKKDIKLKYRRSFLGYIWSILNPLTIMVIQVIVFNNMFKFDIENLPVYLIIGSTIYNCITDSTSQAMWSITGNASLIKKSYVPKYIFTFAKISSCFVNTLFSLGAMIIVFLICNIKINMNMLFIPAILIQIYVFSLGLGMLLAQATVFFRDIQYIYSAFTTAWFYLTPIFYPITQLPHDVAWMIKHFNPAYSYITQFRTIILEHSFPDIRLIIYGFAIAFIMFIVGVWTFTKTQDKFVLYI